MPDGFLNVHRAEVILLAARNRLPAVYPWRFFPEQGGLLSYGSEQRGLFRVAASYVDRILKGEKPADLPVQAPNEYRAGDQPQDCEGARPDGAADAACTAPTSDRMSGC